LDLIQHFFFPQEVANLKQKIEKCEFDLENARKSSELSLVPLTSIAADHADLSDTLMKEMYDF
jgi:nucleoprotein TPR